MLCRESLYQFAECLNKLKKYPNSLKKTKDANKMRETFLALRRPQGPPALVFEVGSVSQYCRNSLDHALNVRLGTDSANAHLPCFLGKLGRMMQRNHEDRGARRAQCDLLGRIESIHPGHLEVQHDDIKLILVELRYRFFPVGSFATNLPVIFGFK